MSSKLLNAEGCCFCAQFHRISVSFTKKTVLLDQWGQKPYHPFVVLVVVGGFQGSGEHGGRLGVSRGGGPHGVNPRVDPRTAADVVLGHEPLVAGAADAETGGERRQQGGAMGGVGRDRHHRLDGKLFRDYHILLPHLLDRNYAQPLQFSCYPLCFYVPESTTERGGGGGGRRVGSRKTPIGGHLYSVQGSGVAWDGTTHRETAPTQQPQERNNAGPSATKTHVDQGPPRLRVAALVESARSGCLRDLQHQLNAPRKTGPRCQPMIRRHVSYKYNSLQRHTRLIRNHSRDFPPTFYEICMGFFYYFLFFWGREKGFPN